MKSPTDFIVRAVNGKRYNNTKEIAGLEIIINTSEENHKASNREAEVVETPIGYNGPIKKGDTLLVHHNVFKFYNDMRGRRKSGRSFFKDDLFFIDDQQFYMYKNKDGWNSIGKYCFIEPTSVKDSYLYKGIKEEPLHGVVKYSNSQLKSIGIDTGCEVIFEPESEYEFTVDGEKLFRMFTNNIVAVL